MARIGWYEVPYNFVETPLNITISYWPQVLELMGVFLDYETTEEISSLLSHLLETSKPLEARRQATSLRKAIPLMYKIQKLLKEGIREAVTNQYTPRCDLVYYGRVSIRGITYRKYCLRTSRNELTISRILPNIACSGVDLWGLLRFINNVAGNNISPRLAKFKKSLEDLASKYSFAYPAGVFVNIRKNIARGLGIPTSIDIFYSSYLRSPLNTWSTQAGVIRKTLGEKLEVAKKLLSKETRHWLFEGEDLTKNEVISALRELFPNKPPYIEPISNEATLWEKEDEWVVEFKCLDDYAYAVKDAAGNITIAATIYDSKIKWTSQTWDSVITLYGIKRVNTLPGDVIKFGELSTELFHVVGDHEAYYHPLLENFFLKAYPGTKIVTISGRVYEFDRKELVALEPLLRPSAVNSLFMVL
ncbi:hypothetical protein [Pyrococcus kukulkanii]|uniref:hypothetical protein n=1 Tax=Pyrococcus kukulkanii TaxID=1609559 RepID=UPI003561C104